jgi:hypothetical protein
MNRPHSVTGRLGILHAVALGADGAPLINDGARSGLCRRSKPIRTFLAAVATPTLTFSTLRTSNTSVSRR